MQRMFERLRAYYQRQRLAGKLNLLLLFLLSVLLANTLAVFGSLTLVYSSNATLWTLERFKVQVDTVEHTLLRFRVTHERVDAQAAHDALSAAEVWLGRIPARVFADPDGAAGEDIPRLMRGFGEQLRAYLYYHEQSVALGSRLRQSSAKLQERVRLLRAQAWPESLDPVLARLVQAILQARLDQQEFVLGEDAALVGAQRAQLDRAIEAALDLRQRAPRIEARIDAYALTQEIQGVAETFGRFAEYTRRKRDNEAPLLRAAQRVAEQVGAAAERQRTTIVRQIVLIVVCTLLASLLLVVLGSLLGRRFVRGLTRPLDELVELSGRLARGDYARRMAVRAPDEIGELATGFNRMADTLQAQIETLQSTGSELRTRSAELESANQALLEAKSATDVLNSSLEAKVLERTRQLETVNRQLTELTVTDALTGLANRRHFDTVLAEEWARALRAGRPLALLMVDVDFFKPYNDRYGHQAGDECLRRVAQFLHATARRAGDLVARYGGEEFVVVSVDTDLSAARSLAEALRVAVAGAGILHEASPLAGGRVTLSVGVAAAVPQPGEGPERLLHQADAALYRAKSGGRNCVALAPGPGE